MAFAEGMLFLLCNICGAACAPVAVLWLFSGAALAALGQQPEIATMAGRYLALCIPCLFMGTAIEV